MSQRTRVLGIVLVVLPSWAYAQTTADSALKPVSVCAILADIGNFSGKSVAVLGRISSAGRGSWEIAGDCAQSTEIDRQAAPSSLWLKYSESSAPRTRDDVLSLDKSALNEELTRVRRAQAGTPRRIWTVLYGRVEAQGVVSGSSNRSPAQLVVRSLYGQSFDEEGHPVEIVLVDNSPGPIETSAPIETTLCDLVQAPERYHSRLVRLRVAVHPFGIEPLVLYDETCSARVRLDDSDPSFDKGTAAARTLYDHLHQNRITEVTVIGKIERVLVYEGDRYLRFSIHSASDVAARAPERR